MFFFSSVSHLICLGSSGLAYPTSGAVKTSMLHGIQMYHIPTSKSAMSERLKNALEGESACQVDEVCYSALKDGGLGALSGEAGLMPLQPGSSSMAPLALANGSDGDDEEIDFTEMSLKVKRAENALKLGLQLLPALCKHSEDCINVGCWMVGGNKCGLNVSTLCHVLQFAPGLCRESKGFSSSNMH